MEYVEFSLNAKLHAHLYGSARERMLALHRGDVLMSRNVTRDGGLMARQVVLEQLMRVGWAARADVA
jgi:hypothetical protein